MNNSLKALFFRTDYYGAVTEGGTVSLHVGKLRGLNQLGHASAYVSTGPMPLPDYVKLYIIRFGKLLMNFPEVLNLPFNDKYNNELLKIIDIEQPDFLIQHHHDFNYSGAELKRKTGLPFLLHADGLEYWIKKNWGKLYLSEHLKMAELIQFQEADAIMVPSKQLANQIIDFYGIESDKFFVAPNGVDTDVFNPSIDDNGIKAKFGLEDKFVVGYTGTFGHWHGIDVLAESVKYLKGRIPNLKVFLVGDGILRPKIEEIIDKDKVRDFVIITGFVPYQTIPNYLSACDVVSTPCVNNDDSPFFNSPVKCFEYMAMGKPIAATDVGQQGDIFQHKTNAMLCGEKDPEALAEIIYQLYLDKELRNSIALQARKDAVEKYTWTKNAEIIIDAYNYSITK